MIYFMQFFSEAKAVTNTVQTNKPQTHILIKSGSKWACAW